MTNILLESLRTWLPETILSVGALAVILVGVWSKRSAPALMTVALTIAAAAVALWRSPVPPDASPFFGLIACDQFSLVFRWLSLGVLALVALLISGSREVDERLRGEYLGLLLFIGVGMMLMAEATHLLMAYVAMELVSLSSYMLVAFLNDRRSSEAALKYLLYGALSSGVMLFGLSLLFGLTGHLSFAGILDSIRTLPSDQQAALLMVFALLLTGLAFKISMVPFHMWTPDAYEGAPIPVAALLSVGPKAAGLALLIRLSQALSPAWPLLQPLVIGLTILTMTLGNLVALVQTNVKRLLAYSTIGQVGYLLIGFAVNNQQGIDGLLFYLIAYAFMNLGAFTCVVSVVEDAGSESLDAFRGLSRRSPALALVFALFLLSLAGIPPLLGFFGKFLLLGAAMQAQQGWLAIAAILNSAIALYYYVNLIRLIYLATPARGDALRVPTPWPTGIALGICAAGTLVVGLYPGPLLKLLQTVSVPNLL